MDDVLGRLDDDDPENPDDMDDGDDKTVTGTDAHGFLAEAD